MLYKQRAVSYKENGTIPNDTRLIGIFNEPIEGEVMEIVDYYGFSMNNPVYPGVVPRFKTMDELTGNMSQVLTEFTTIPTVIQAVYNPATDSSAGSFMFGIQLEKEYEHEVSFSNSVSLGDLTTLAVEDSSLLIMGSFSLLNEFSVMLGPDENEGLKMFSQVRQTNCTSSDQNFDFEMILEEEDGSLITEAMSIASCVEGVIDRVQAVNTIISNVIGEENITVSLVGSSTIVLAFHPKYSKVELLVAKKNIYGLKNETMIKSQYHFEIGAANLDLEIGISGGVTVSANVLDVVEVEASIEASIEGDLQFHSGISKQFVPMSLWFSNVRAMFNASDEFHDPDFATCTVTLNGDFDSSAALREPFHMDYPESFKGYFNEPFKLNLLDISEVKSSPGPDITLDIDFPNFGKMFCSHHYCTDILAPYLDHLITITLIL